jgi:hypothetical protein
LFRIFCKGTDSIYRFFVALLYPSKQMSSEYFDLATTVPSFKKFSITSILKHPTIRRNIIKMLTTRTLQNKSPYRFHWSPFHADGSVQRNIVSNSLIRNKYLGWGTIFFTNV